MTKSVPTKDLTLYEKYKGGFDLIGAAGVSLFFQPGSTFFLNLAARKAVGVPYPEAFKNMTEEGLQRFLEQTRRVYARRFGSSILTGTFLQNIWDLQGWGNVSLTAISAITESVIASTIIKEAGERFNANNGSKYPFAGFDLTKMTEQQFRDNKAKNPITASHGEKEWKILEAMQNNFKANALQQFSLLLARNSFFSAAVFGVGPLAAKISDGIGKGEDGKDIVDRGNLKFALRTGLAASTTIFDRLLTVSSTGELSAKQIAEITFNNIAKGNVRSLMVGGLARTALCVLNSTVFDYGLNQGSTIGEFVDKMINFSTPSSEYGAKKESDLVINPDEILDLNSLQESTKKIDLSKTNQELQKSGVSGIILDPKSIEKAVEASAKSVVEIGGELVNEVERQSAKGKPSTSISISGTKNSNLIEKASKELTERS